MDRKLAKLKTVDGPMISAFRKESNEASNSFEGIEMNDEVHSETLRPVLCDRLRSALRESFRHIRENQSLQDATVFRHEQILLLNDSDTERDSEGATELEAYGNDAIKRLTKKFAVSLQVMDVQIDEILPQLPSMAAIQALHSY